MGQNSSRCFVCATRQMISGMYWVVWRVRECFTGYAIPDPYPNIFLPSYAIVYYHVRGLL